jgi:riboflavin transporter FmnP
MSVLCKNYDFHTIPISTGYFFTMPWCPPAARQMAAALIKSRPQVAAKRKNMTNTIATAIVAITIRSINRVPAVRALSITTGMVVGVISRPTSAILLHSRMILPLRGHAIGKPIVARIVVVVIARNPLSTIANGFPILAGAAGQRHRTMPSAGRPLPGTQAVGAVAETVVEMAGLVLSKVQKLLS